MIITFKYVVKYGMAMYIETAEGRKTICNCGCDTGSISLVSVPPGMRVFYSDDWTPELENCVWYIDLLDLNPANACLQF